MAHQATGMAAPSEPGFDLLTGGVSDVTAVVSSGGRVAPCHWL